MTETGKVKLDRTAGGTEPAAEVGRLRDELASTRDQVESLSVALGEAEAHRRAMLASFDGLIYVSSPDYVIEFMNQRLVDRTGGDVTGQPCYRVLHDLTEVCPWCDMDRVIAGETVRWEIQDPRDESWYGVVNTPLRRADGRVSRHSIIQDVSERRRAREALSESEEKYRTLFETSIDGILLWTPDLRLVDLNAAAVQMFGRERAELMGASAADLIGDVITYGAPEVVRGGRTTGGVFIEAEGRGPDGATFPIEVSTRAVSVGGRRLVLAWVRDIAARQADERHRDGLIDQLLRALAQVKELRGLIPICSACKKIRNDQGFWQRVEVYIEAHSSAQFTHGICPDCVERLYPELARARRDRQPQ